MAFTFSDDSPIVGWEVLKPTSLIKRQQVPPSFPKDSLSHPDAIVALLAWPLFHTQAALSSRHGSLDLVIREACRRAFAPIRGSRRRHPRHPTERSEVNSPGMPRVFRSQSRTPPCPRPGVRTEYMDFSARSSNASFPFRSGYTWEYGRLLYSAKRFKKAVANVMKRTTPITRTRILSSPVNGSFSSLGCLVSACGLLQHPRQRKASSSPQKQSSCSALGLCFIVVQASCVRSDSVPALAPEERGFHNQYQYA